MKLKVVKYKNYGCMMESGENEDLYDNYINGFVYIENIQENIAFVY
jgi:hypothetical protein